MKNLFKVTMLAAFAMAFAACSNDLTEDIAPATGKRTISVSVDAQMTRTVLNDDRSALSWVNGDAFGYFTNDDTDTANGKVTYDGSDTYILTVGENATEVYAYYPYYADNSSKTASTINLGSDKEQTQSAGGVFHGGDYPMAAKGVISGSSANLTFKPVASAIAFNVYNTDGPAADEKVEHISLAATKVSGYHNYDLTTEAFVADPWNNTVKVTLTNPVTVASAKPAVAKDYTDQIYLMVNKGSYTDASLEIKTTTNTYTFSGLDLDLTKDIVAMNVDLKKGTVQAKKEYFAVTELDEIDVTATYVIGGNNKKSFAESTSMMIFTGSTDGSQCVTTSATFEDNSFSNNAIADVKLEATGTANTYYIKVGDKYLCNTSSSSSSRSLAMNTSNPTAWTFVNKEGYEGFMFHSTINGTTYEMGCNSGSSNSLRLYGNTTTTMQGAIYLFREVGTGGAIAPKVSVSATELSLAAGATATPYPTFTVSVNSTGSLDKVTMTGAPAWLTVDFNKTTGVVTYNASANSDTAERTATLNFAMEGGNNVDVVIKQAGYVASGVVKTVSMESFTTVSGDIDTVISYKAEKGSAGTAPAINNNRIRLYQKGGFITISAVSGYKIQSVTITTSSTYDSTTVKYAIDGGTQSEGETVAKETDFTVDELSASNVAFYCAGTDKNTRLEIAKISVTYISE